MCAQKLMNSQLNLPHGTKQGMNSITGQPKNAV